VKEIIADPKMIACCGLYCGACRKYRQEKCPGCAGNVKASWCGIRTCVAEHGYTTCADCKEFPDPNNCRKFNNFFSKVFGLMFNSNRQSCILKIRELGLENYAEYMKEKGLQSLPRRGAKAR